MISIRSILFIGMLGFAWSISVSQILDIFGDKNCIPGSLLSLQENQDKVIKQDAPLSNIILDTISPYVDNEKTAASYIEELARYNGISNSYEVIKEEGPAHSKVFTIALYLGDERYEGEMTSIKKAQQEAAKMALKNTKYEHPPVKIKESERALTPTAVLNNLAQKLGLQVTYTLVTEDILANSNNQSDSVVMSKKSYLQKLNETVHMNNTIHVRKDGGESKGPFTISVDVNGNRFFGKAHTKQQAKHEAASKALNSLKDNREAFDCLKEGDNCNSNKQTTKSPISLVYEAAQKRNLALSFEIIDEVGPSHKKIFTTKCVAGELESTGQGKSKKESKRVAAENMLPSLMKLPEVEKGSARAQSGSKKSKKNKKKNKVIKTTFDKIDRMFDNIVDYGKNVIDSITGTNEDSSSNDQSKKRRSPTEELLQLGKILDLQLQFTDLLENDKTYSLLDFSSKPLFLCLGEGINQKNSRDLASKYGINLLYKLGLLDNVLDKTMTISNVLDKEEQFDKFWLNVVEEEKEKDEL